MANYLYNGVELPDINAVWTDKETYPYAIIGNVEPGLEGYYALGLYTTTGVYNSGNGQVEASSSCSYLAYIYGSGEYGEYDSWTLVDQSDSAQAGSSLSYEPVTWSNHDILNADGSVYLAASTPVPVGGSKLTISTGGGGVSYNGVELPGINEVWTDELKAKYPYACIQRFDYTELGVGIVFALAATKTPFVYDTLTGHWVYGQSSQQDYLDCTLLDGVWYAEESTTGDDVYISVRSEHFVWTNTDLVDDTGTVIHAASNPVSGGVTDTTATVNFSCSDLTHTDAVYKIMAWVYKKTDGLDTTKPATFTSNLFAGTTHSEAHTFTGLAPNTEYECYAVIAANDVATEHNAVVTFTTLEGEAVDFSDAALEVVYSEITSNQAYIEVNFSGIPQGDDLYTYVDCSLDDGTTVRDNPQLINNPLTGAESGVMEATFYDLEPATEYTATFKIVYRLFGDSGDYTDTSISTTATFTTDKEGGFDRDSFLLGMASGLGCTAVTQADADADSWAQGYIVGTELRKAVIS